MITNKANYFPALIRYAGASETSFVTCPSEIEAGRTFTVEKVRVGGAATTVAFAPSSAKLTALSPTKRE